MYEKEENISDLSCLTEIKARKNGDKIAILNEDRHLSYWELNELASRFARGLLGLGVEKGDKIVVIFPNSIEFLYIWFGIMKIGAVAVPLNTALKGPLLSYQINDSDAKVAVVSKQVLPAYNEVKKLPSEM
jgi:crotonobetaine/carnitine-CoA ligase